MKKLLVVGFISSFISAGAFAAACTATAAAPGTNTPDAVIGSATAPSPGEMCVCNGGNAARLKVNGGSGTVITTPVFVKNGFDVQCSNKTVVAYNEVSANAFAVGSGSLKGNQSFQGSSGGGAVTTSAKCTDTNDSCNGANVSTALGVAVTALGAGS